MWHFQLLLWQKVPPLLNPLVTAQTRIPRNPKADAGLRTELLAINVRQVEHPVLPFQRRAVGAP